MSKWSVPPLEYNRIAVWRFPSINTKSTISLMIPNILTFLKEGFGPSFTNKLARSQVQLRVAGIWNLFRVLAITH